MGRERVREAAEPQRVKEGRSGEKKREMQEHVEPDHIFFSPQPFLFCIFSYSTRVPRYTYMCIDVVEQRGQADRGATTMKNHPLLPLLFFSCCCSFPRLDRESHDRNERESFRREENAYPINSCGFSPVIVEISFFSPLFFFRRSSLQ